MNFLLFTILAFSWTVYASRKKPSVEREFLNNLTDEFFDENEEVAPPYERFKDDENGIKRALLRMDFSIHADYLCHQATKEIRAALDTGTEINYSIKPHLNNMSCLLGFTFDCSTVRLVSNNCKDKDLSIMSYEEFMSKSHGQDSSLASYLSFRQTSGYARFMDCSKYSDEFYSSLSILILAFKIHTLEFNKIYLKNERAMHSFANLLSSPVKTLLLRKLKINNLLKHEFLRSFKICSLAHLEISQSNIFFVDFFLFIDLLPQTIEVLNFSWNPWMSQALVDRFAYNLMAKSSFVNLHSVTLNHPDAQNSLNNYPFLLNVFNPTETAIIDTNMSLIDFLSMNLSIFLYLTSFKKWDFSYIKNDCIWNEIASLICFTPEVKILANKLEFLTVRYVLIPQTTIILDAINEFKALKSLQCEDECSQFFHLYKISRNI